MRQSVAGHFTKIDICREVFALLGSDAVNLPIYRLPRGKVPFASDGVEIAFFASDTNFFAISPTNNFQLKMAQALDWDALVDPTSKRFLQTVRPG